MCANGCHIFRGKRVLGVRLSGERLHGCRHGVAKPYGKDGDAAILELGCGRDGLRVAPVRIALLAIGQHHHDARDARSHICCAWLQELVRDAEPIGDVGVAQVVLQRADGLRGVGRRAGKSGEHGGGVCEAHDAHLSATCLRDALVLERQCHLVCKLFHLVHPRPHRTGGVDDEHQFESGVARWRERRGGRRRARAVTAPTRLWAPVSDECAERGVRAVCGELVATGRLPSECEPSDGNVTKLPRGACGAGDGALIGDATLKIVLIGAVAGELLTGCGSTFQEKASIIRGVGRAAWR